MERVETYTTPLVVDSTEDIGVDVGNVMEATEARAFLEQFDVSERTDEIIGILQANEAVKTLFEELVPMEVSYEQFWARYFFRCDMQRIRQPQELQEQTTKQESKWLSLPNPLNLVFGTTFDCATEVAFRRNLRDVYTTPLLCSLHDELDTTHDSNSRDTVSWDILYEMKETREFLSAFDVYEKTDEIASTLMEHSETVRVHFEALVPVDVTYGEFWARYFFRCDQDRITRAWVAHQNHVKQERRQAIYNVKTVVAKKSKDVIVNPIRTVLKTSYHLGNAAVSTALLPVGLITNVATNIMFKDETETVSDRQARQRVKLLQKKLMETKRELRESKADAFRLRNQLMKAHDALHVRTDNIAPVAISFPNNSNNIKVNTATCIEDSTSSSATTEECCLVCDGDDDWSNSAGKERKDVSETSATVYEDDGSTSSVLSPLNHIPSPAVFEVMRNEHN